MWSTTMVYSSILNIFQARNYLLRNEYHPLTTPSKDTVRSENCTYFGVGIYRIEHFFSGCEYPGGVSFSSAKFVVSLMSIKSLEFQNCSHTRNTAETRMLFLFLALLG